VSSGWLRGEVEGCRVGWEEARCRGGEDGVLVVHWVVHQHVQVGDAHPGVLPDAETPQRVDAGGSLGQRGLRLLYGCATPTLQKSQMSNTGSFMGIFLCNR
jgi:hypothetical protein